MKVDKVPRMRRVTITTLICALIFGLLTTWLGPRMIAYWYTPPVPEWACNFTVGARGAMSELVLTQIIGTCMGVVVGIILGIFMGTKGAGTCVESPPTQ